MPFPSVVVLFGFRLPVDGLSKLAARPSLHARPQPPFEPVRKIVWGPAVRDFGCGQGGEAGASPQRAVTAEPTQAADKRSTAGPHTIFRTGSKCVAGSIKQKQKSRYMKNMIPRVRPLVLT